MDSETLRWQAPKWGIDREDPSSHRARVVYLLYLAVMNEYEGPPYLRTLSRTHISITLNEVSGWLSLSYLT